MTDEQVKALCNGAIDGYALLPRSRENDEHYAKGYKIGTQIHFEDEGMSQREQEIIRLLGVDGAQDFLDAAQKAEQVSDADALRVRRHLMDLDKQIQDQIQRVQDAVDRL